MNHWLITDSFLQVACYAGHFGPYGERHFRVFNVFGRLSVCVGGIDYVCEPATTGAFLPSCKEAIGSVQLECCVHKWPGGFSFFETLDWRDRTKYTYSSEATSAKKVSSPKKACESHVM